MAKKQFTTVNINDFFAPEPGSPAPVTLTTTSGSPLSPVSRSSNVISSSGGTEKIPTSRRGFDDDPDRVSKRRGKNRGGRSGKGSIPTPHILDASNTNRSTLMQNLLPKEMVPQGYFNPIETKLKGGKTKFVNPLNQNQVIFTRDKNGRIKFINPEFTFNKTDNLARKVDDVFTPNKVNADLDPVYLRPKNGAPISTPASRYDPMGEGVLRPLPKGERAAFDHRRKMKARYNNPERRSYLTREDRLNTANMERRQYTVGRYSGSVAEYKAKVAKYIMDLENELSYLDAGSKKQVRRAIIEDTLADLRKEMRKTADQINPSISGLPHKLEMKMMESLKEDDKPLNFLTNPSSRQNAIIARRKAIRAGVIKPMQPMESYVSRVDRLMQSGMQESYMSSKGYGTDNLLQDQPDFIRSRTRTPVSINNLTSSTRGTSKQYTPSSVSRYLQTANISSSQPAANIASAVGETLPTGTPGRMMSSTAKRLADDTMRAASVIHSSKLGFAAIGMGALGAAFGISSLRSKASERQMEMGNRI